MVSEPFEEKYPALRNLRGPFAEANYGWESVEGKYTAMIDSISMTKGEEMRRTGPKTIPHG